MSRASETAPVPFYEGAFVQASPEIERIRKDLPNFSSPELRVQRVGQLDSHLLDQELADLLTQPVKNALRKVSPKFEQRYNSELLVALRLILYKFSIYDRGATYGAMLQNLKYRNEWAHRARCTYRENLANIFFLQCTQRLGMRHCLSFNLPCIRCSRLFCHICTAKPKRSCRVTNSISRQLRVCNLSHIRFQSTGKGCGA